MIGTHTIGVSAHYLPEAENAALPLLSVRHARYRLEIWYHNEDKDADLCISDIPVFSAASHHQTLNEPDELTVSVPKTEYCVDYMTEGKWITVFDWKDEVVDEFLIWDEGDTVSTEEDIRTVRAMNRLSQLGQEYVTGGYLIRRAENKSLLTALKELLAYQELEPKIELGIINPDFDLLPVSLSSPEEDPKTVLALLGELQNQVGGVFWTAFEGDISTGHRKLHWDFRRGRTEFQPLTYSRNVRGLTRTVNRDDQVTKLWYYGKKLSARRLNLKDAGESEEFLLSTNWPLIKRKKYIFDDAISDPAELLEAAELYLADHENPTASYDLEAIDYSEWAGWEYPEWERLEIGSQCVIEDAKFAPQGLLYDIVDLTRDLLDPINIQAKLDRHVIRLSDLLVPDESEDTLEIWRVDDVSEINGGLPGDLVYTGGEWYGLQAEGVVPPNDATLVPLGGTPVTMPTASTEIPPGIDDTGAVGTPADNCFANWDHTHAGVTQQEFDDLYEYVLTLGSVKWFDTWGELVLYAPPEQSPFAGSRADGHIYAYNPTAHFWTPVCKFQGGDP